MRAPGGPRRRRALALICLCTRGLKPGVALEAARSEMDAIGRQLEAQYPDESRGHGAHVVALRDEIVGPVRQRPHRPRRRRGLPAADRVHQRRQPSARARAPAGVENWRSAPRSAPPARGCCGRRSPKALSLAIAGGVARPAALRPGCAAARHANAARASRRRPRARATRIRRCSASRWRCVLLTASRRGSAASVAACRATIPASRCAKAAGRRRACARRSAGSR